MFSYERGTPVNGAPPELVLLSADPEPPMWRLSWVIDSGLVGPTDFHLSRRGAARAEDASGTPTLSHISPSILA